jgi:hypothetical protein
MTATAEAPPPAAPVVPRIDVTREELVATTKWFKENVRMCPVVPPLIKNYPGTWPLTPEQVLTAHKRGQTEQIGKIIDAINAGVRAMEVDPLNYGYEPECWRDAD